MATEQEILDELEKAIQNTNRSNDDLLRVFVNDEETYITLRDGEVVPSLDKRVDIKVKAIGEDYIQQLDDTIAQFVEGGVPDLAVKTWSGRTQEQKNKENLSVDDFATIDEAIAYAKNVGLKIDGLGKTVVVSVLPTDLSVFKNIAFKVGDITHPTDDFLGISLKQITKTPTYTGWAQDKACQHKGVIYVPIMLAHGHTYDTTRLAWVKSFDGGNTWTSPEILLEQHPTPTRGWSSLSAGVIGNRFVMIVEERDVATELTINTFIYDRILYLSETVTNGVALTAGSSVATITLANHSLVVGDKVNFSGVSGTDVGGLSGELAVVSVVDANRFTVNKGSNSATTQVDTGGASWTLGSTFYANTWRTTNIGTLPDGSGNPVTHVHSFAVKDLNAGELFLGFHNGSGAREVGALLVSNFWKNPTVVKRRLPALAEASQAEPVVRYDSGKLYITTRGQSRTSNGSIFAWSADNGVTWTWYRFPNNLHYSPLPLVIKDGVAYIFGTERAENEWLATVDNRNNQNRPRSFMLQALVGELEVGNFANLTTTLLGYGIYQGEQVSTGVGVGSAILYGNSLRYYFMSEDYRNSTRYSLNFPATDNEYLADGYQPDMFEYRIDLIIDRAGKNDFILQAADNQHIAVYRNAASEYEVQQPLRYKNTQALPRLAVGKTSSIVGDVLAYVNTRAEGSAYIPTPYADNIYRTAGDYAALLPSTTSGSDTKYAVLGGGGAVSSARGAMVLAYGANHATSPNEVRINALVGLSPSNDNLQTLGKASNRWSTVYAGTGTINTSDFKLKEQITDLSEAENAVALSLKPLIKKFKFKDVVLEKGDLARWHVGVIAQEVVAAFESQGLNAFDYGIVCFDEWEAQEAIYGEDGELIQEAQEAGSRYAIRYDELAMFILSSI